MSKPKTGLLLMIAPDAAAPDAAKKMSGSADEQCVSLKSLAVDGTAPAVGDAVDFQASGKITRIVGDHAYVAVETANGEPIPAENEAEEAPSEDESAMDAAMKADAGDS